MIGNHNQKNSMPKRTSKFSNSLKQLGEIQVTEWDFMDLLNKDIGDLEITHSLRRLGNMRVMEWDFKTVLPAVNRLAHQEVDLIGFVKRTARYKVLDWDFRSPLPAKPLERCLSPADMQALVVRLKSFLQYVVVRLIDEPGHAQIKVREIQPNVLRFKLVLVQRDVAMLIGREGHTASAIRNILKAAAGSHGVRALLQIHSHEEEITLGKGERGEIGPCENLDGS
jgi:predicted RNA-binding protein YlqC (UPF0109 family)